MIPETTKWHKCYDDGWKGIIVPESFQHPAKMSYGLLKRILAHAKEQGWVEEGDVILDPFGGIGSTGILGAYEGYQVVCVELEAKFFDLALLNFELHDNAWSKLGCPRPRILQGDSRRLCEIVEKADIIVSSPPFMEQMQQPKGSLLTKWCEQHGRNPDAPSRKQIYDAYGQTPGQLGAMKPGNVDCILSSPPYAESMSSGQCGIDLSKAANPKDRRERNDHSNVCVPQRYSTSKQNLGNLKSGDVDLVLSSPPWENQEPSHAQNDTPSRRKLLSRGISRKFLDSEYGKSAGQIGNDKGDTFWSAARIIVQQCHQILKPGGHAIWVVKSFVRNKKIVDFPGDWQRLCEAAGFKTVCIHHAMLVKETKHETLFGHTEVKRTERKSFFRRLAEAKGSPRIDFEVVLCMVKETK